MRSSLVPARNDLFYPLEQQFNKFFDEFFGEDSLSSVQKNVGFPKLNAYEKNGELVVYLSVSGMTTDDLAVEVSPTNVLSIRGRMSKEFHTPEHAEKIYFAELRTSAFERKLQLPDHIVGDPSASLKDGMLTLKWATKLKDLPKNKSKSISIKSE